MRTNKVLFFLDFLTNQTQGCEEMLTDLYNRALDDNDEVQALRKLLNDCIFLVRLEILFVWKGAISCRKCIAIQLKH